MGGEKSSRYSGRRLGEQVEYIRIAALSLTPRLIEVKKRENGIRSCFNSFSARADVNLGNICALDDKPTN